MRPPIDLYIFMWFLFLLQFALLRFSLCRTIYRHLHGMRLLVIGCMNQFFMLLRTSIFIEVSPCSTYSSILRWIVSYHSRGVRLLFSPVEPCSFHYLIRMIGIHDLLIQCFLYNLLLFCQNLLLIGLVYQMFLVLPLLLDIGLRMFLQ